MSILKAAITSGDHVLGAADAPATVVEYGDYQCPNCARAHRIVQDLLLTDGRMMRFVFRHFPLSEVHPMAAPAAEAAEFAGSKARFWPMHDALFQNQLLLSFELFETLALQLGLSETQLIQALQAGTFAGKVQADFLGGVRSGVNGTPTFFINGVRHDGGYEFAELSAAIHAATSSVARAS